MVILHDERETGAGYHTRVTLSRAGETRRPQVADDSTRRGRQWGGHTCARGRTPGNSHEVQGGRGPAVPFGPHGPSP
jgi:hypothetical protein